ncbi:MAG TPA: di-trans,poly-cis-decaprenylcistransferase [Candidatus Polarisedimenticolaceae bacterium]|nr:di-trans,poly-cis-decaprenylcistransferase [Candidatus Polarisedimenticolaceae bacterium]
MSPLHVAIVMDGNGRWARSRGLPRLAGHRAGAQTVRRVVEAARKHDIGTLTLYAFSCDNWSRPAPEVGALMQLLESYLRKEVSRCVENDVRLRVIGRRDRLPARVVAAIEAAEQATAGCTRFQLRLAVDYSSRWAITAAAALAVGRQTSYAEFGALLNRATGGDPAPPEVDLLIRTSGEQRLSDFMLWECAYAELLFTPQFWPDFGEADLAAAIAEFRTRERRFGRVLEPVAAPASRRSAR